jgi:hypothetical protein
MQQAMKKYKEWSFTILDLGTRWLSGASELEFPSENTTCTEHN